MQFQRELSDLKQRVLDMGMLAESMVADASRAVFKHEKEGITNVLAAEPKLDRFQIEIDREAIRLITIYTPVARDLRFLLMIVRINSELERIGDQAVDNCEYVQDRPGPQRSPDDLLTMSEIVIGMVHDALQAFRQEDTKKAEAVMSQDDRVDALDAQIAHRLFERPAPDAESRAWSMSMVLVARSLERIADHATNICEEVFYVVEGADIRHRT
jgi:phosphate transport system protein